jgi:hypothetical protein
MSGSTRRIYGIVAGGCAIKANGTPSPLPAVTCFARIGPVSRVFSEWQQPTILLFLLAEVFCWTVSLHEEHLDFPPASEPHYVSYQQCLM